MSRQSEVANRMLNTLVLRTQSQKILEPITGKWKVRVVKYVEKQYVLVELGSTEWLATHQKLSSQKLGKQEINAATWPRLSEDENFAREWHDSDLAEAARTWAEAEQLDGEGIRTLNACLQLMVASQHGCPGFPAQVWQSHVVVPPRNAVSR